MGLSRPHRPCLLHANLWICKLLIKRLATEPPPSAMRWSLLAVLICYRPSIAEGLDLGPHHPSYTVHNPRQTRFAPYEQRAHTPHTHNVSKRRWWCFVSKRLASLDLFSIAIVCPSLRKTHCPYLYPTRFPLFFRHWKHTVAGETASVREGTLDKSSLFDLRTTQTPPLSAYGKEHPNQWLRRPPENSGKPKEGQFVGLCSFVCVFSVFRLCGRLSEDEQTFQKRLFKRCTDAPQIQTMHHRFRKKRCLGRDRSRASCVMFWHGTHMNLIHNLENAPPKKPLWI